MGRDIFAIQFPDGITVYGEMKVRNINDSEYAISIESFPIIESIFVGSPDKKYRLSIGVDRIRLAKEMISELI